MKNVAGSLTRKFGNHLFLFFLLMTIVTSVFSQNVGINTTGAVPNAAAGLDVDFPNKGVLIPRVALTNTTSFAPLSAHVAGMVVYNTATAGNVKPGFYYNNGSVWIPAFPSGTAIGNMLYWDGTTWVVVPAGLPGQYLQLNGSQLPFWGAGGASATMTTTAASLVTGTTATTGGNITADGGLAVVTRGVCYATTANPTIANSTLVAIPATGIGVFTSNLTGLTAATTYYVRAYAINSSVVSYGNQITFTTSAVLPTLAATTAATAITSTSAVSGGNITSDGGATVTERGVCYAITANPTVADTRVVDPGTGPGTFVSNITGLLGYTTYYVRSYATSSAGTAYGAQISFRTLTTPPTLTTVAATTITGATAVSGGSMIWGGGGYSNYQNYGVAYATTPGSPTPTFVATNINNGSVNPAVNISPWVTNITGLAANTTYYIRAYLMVYPTGTGPWTTVYGNELSFTTTGPTAPIVATTTAATVLSSTAANSGGTITSDGGSAITAKGVCWGVAANPTVGVGNFTSNGTGTAAYASNLTGLTGSTLYHARAYATNAIGTSYGPDITFTTWVPAPYALGQDLGYGWCAYVAPDGTGMIVSYDIPSTTQFGCPGITIGGSAAYGSGVSNTNLILAACATRPIAASIAAGYGGGGFNDWCLPSNGDWALIAANYNLLGLGGHSYNNYYTSTPYLFTSYASTYFATGSQVYGSGAQRVPGMNDYVSFLRAVRYFTGFEKPSVTTATVINITATGATSGGTIGSDGGKPITAYGVCWSTTTGPTIANAHTTDGTGVATFASTITGLTVGTTYYVRAYATNSVGTSYGNELSFFTVAPVLATVTTDPITNLTATGATSGGNVSSDGGATVDARGVCWGTAVNPTVANSILADATGGTGTFFSNLTGLVPGTTYHLRAYAHNSVGYAYGSDVTFTPSNLATVTTDPMGSLVGAVAEGNYTVVSEGAGGITAVGLVWGTTVNPTITTNTGILTDPNYWPGSTGMSFPLDLTGLTVNTLYHVRAYATNSSGTAYGADVTFTATPAVLGQMVQLNYNSGYVFSLDATGTHGLIAMTYNLGTSDWGCTNTPVTTGTAVGTGSANTDAINLNISTNACMSAAMNMGFASQLTKMYGVEWFLPSKDELNLLWTNRTADASGALAAALSSAIGFAPIWSSSQVDNTHAWSFNGTMVSTGLKTGQYYVWPVRAF